MISKYNILALINVVSGFMVTFTMMKYFGSSKEVDIYFTSILVLMNFNVLVGFTYASFLPHYLKLKNTNHGEATEFYKITLVTVIVISTIVLSLYIIVYKFYISYSNFIFNDFTYKYMYIILFLGIFETNNFLLNANHYYALPYILLIFINLLNSLGIILFHNFGLEIIIYSNLLAYIISIIVQFLIVKRNVNLAYNGPSFNRILFIKTIQDSFIIKSSSVINGTTDIVIAYTLTSFGDGIYAIYSYARKFALAVFNIANGPTIKKFNTDIAPYILDFKYDEIIKKAKRTLFSVLPLIIVGEVIVYYLLEFLLPVLTNKFSDNQILLMQNIFIYIGIFYCFLAVEYVLMTIISQLHAFKYGLVINMIYAFIFFSSALLIYLTYHSYLLILLMLIISITISIILETLVVKKLLLKGKI